MWCNSDNPWQAFILQRGHGSSKQQTPHSEYDSKALIKNT